MSRELDELIRTLGYRFNNIDLLRAALTHRSAGSDNNERLEFLGDAILGYVIAEWLFEHFPEAPEGQLSRLRSSLVKRESLAGIARELQLGEYLRLGSGELKSGGFRRDSILSDAFEAILGAILLDSDQGLEASRACIYRFFADKIDKLSPDEELKDPKTRLQEYLQSNKYPLPTYEVQNVSGQAHAQKFVVECRVEGLERTTRGEGRSRRRAEQAAAKHMLQQLDGIL